MPCALAGISLAAVYAAKAAAASRAERFPLPAPRLRIRGLNKVLSTYCIASILFCRSVLSDAKKTLARTTIMFL